MIDALFRVIKRLGWALANVGVIAARGPYPSLVYAENKMSTKRPIAAGPRSSKQYKMRDVIDNDQRDNPLTFFVGWHRANNTHEKNARRTPVMLLLFLISTSVAPI